MKNLIWAAPFLAIACAGQEPYLERNPVVKRLAEENNVQGLKRLAYREIKGSDEAAWEACKRLNPTEAVAFCKSLKPDSKQWFSAFDALAFHPKEAVINYVLKMVESNNPYVRAYCYTICTTNKWEELRDFAGKDKENEAPICEINAFYPGQTLGHLARKYLATVETAPRILSQTLPQTKPDIKTLDPINQSNFERIRRGMSIAQVEEILGRSADGTLLPGGTLGDTLCFWNGERVTIFVEFSLVDGMRVGNASLTKR